VIGHHRIALGDLRAIGQSGSHEADQVPVRRIDHLQALRHGERNGPPAGGVLPDEGIAATMLAGSLLD